MSMAISAFCIFDRHTDMGELNIDERMHGTPFFHATNIPNAPPVNLVQIGIGGWNGSRFGVKNARERGATSITMTDIDRFGLERIRRDGARYCLEECVVRLSFVRYRLGRIRRSRLEPARRNQGDFRRAKHSGCCRS